MKKTLLFLAAVIFLSSCAVTWSRIGSLTSVSTRNLDSASDYIELMRYVEATDDGEIWHTGATGIKQKVVFKSRDNTLNTKLDGINLAIDNAVRSVPGGEFLRNVQVFHSGTGHIKVTGDVWGKKLSADQLADFYKGVIQIGDRVHYISMNKQYAGEVVLIQSHYAKVKRDDNQRVVQVDLKNITKD